MALIDKQLDTHHLPAPSSILRTLSAVATLQSGQVLQLSGQQHGMITAIQSLCNQTGLVLMQYMEWDGEYTFLIRKPEIIDQQQPPAYERINSVTHQEPDSPVCSLAMN